MNVEANLENYYQATNEAFRIFHAWPPEHIRLAPPSMVCIVLGPAAMYLRVARHLRGTMQSQQDNAQCLIREKLLTLFLTQFARLWKIGRLTLGMLCGPADAVRTAAKGFIDSIRELDGAESSPEFPPSDLHI